MSRTLDTELLAKLVCPISRTPLRYDEAAQELISDAAGVAFPIRNGTPVLLIEEARRIGGCGPISADSQSSRP